MQFRYPEYSWTFLLLLIPVLIHVLRFRKQQVRYFPGVFRLVSLLKETKSTRNIKQYLLLLNRLLLVFLIAWSFSQPSCSSQDFKLKADDPQLGILWDASPSMWEADAKGLIPVELAKKSALINLKSLPENAQIYWIDRPNQSELKLSKYEAIERVNQMVKPLEPHGLKTLCQTNASLIGVKKWFVISDLDSDALEGFSTWVDSQSVYHFIDFQIERNVNYSLDTAYCSDVLQGYYHVKISRNQSQNAVSFFMDISQNDAFVGNEAIKFEEKEHSIWVKIRLPEASSKRLKFSLPKDAYAADNELFLHPVGAHKLKVFVQSDADISDLDQLLWTLRDRIERTDSVQDAQTILVVTSQTDKSVFESLAPQIRSGKQCIIIPNKKASKVPFDLLKAGVWERNKYRSTGDELDFRSFRQEPFQSSMETFLDGKVQLPKFEELFTFSYAENSDWSRILITESDRDFLLSRELGEGKVWLFLSDYSEGMRNLRKTSWFLGILGPILLSNHASTDAICAFSAREWIALPQSTKFKLQDPVRIQRGGQSWASSLGLNQGRLSFLGVVGESLQAGWYTVIKSDATDSVLVALNFPRKELQYSQEDILLFDSPSIKRISPSKWNISAELQHTDLNKPGHLGYWVLLLLLLELTLSVFVLRTNR